MGYRFQRMHPLSSYLKVITVILLAISINLPYFVTKHVLEFQRKAIRREVKAKINAGLKDEQLIKLVFNKSELSSRLVWHKIDEFEYQNKMYDIVRKHETTDSIEYFCWQDDDESEIKMMLNKMSALEWHNNKEKDHQKDRQTEYYKNLICSVKYELHPNFSTPIVNPGEKTNYKLNFKSVFPFQPLGPPPEISFC